MGVLPMVMKFKDFKVQYFTGLICVQNLFSLELLPQIFGLANRNLPELDHSTARIKSLFLLISFANILAMAASFSESELGGKCTDEYPIPMIQTWMLASQLFVHLYIILEHCCGYGTVQFEQSEKSDPASKLEIMLFQ